MLTKDDPSLWPTLSPNVQVRGARSRCEPPHKGSELLCLAAFVERYVLFKKGLQCRKRKCERHMFLQHLAPVFCRR